MFNIYSPISPIKNNCIPPIINTPIVKGAVPAEKLSQLIIFITVYTRATTILIAEQANPRNVAKRKPTFVYDVKLSIAASYKL